MAPLPPPPGGVGGKRPIREWDRGKTRTEDDLDAPVRLGGPAAPTFVAARDARSQLPPPPAGASPAPRAAAEKPAADPAARRLERWRRDLEREDRDARQRDDAHFRDRERRWERDEADRFRARARREARAADAARARARDLREDLEPDEDERAVAARLAKETAPGDATPAPRRRLLDALVAAGPPGWFLDARDVARRRRYREREREEEARDEKRLAELEARGDAERTRANAETSERDAAPAPAPEPAGEGPSAPERPRDARADVPASSAPAPALVALSDPVSAPAPAPAPAAAMTARSPEKPAPPARLKTKIAGKRKLASTLLASSAFGEDDEEEVKVERRLVPIEYTPEELAAASMPASTMAEEERREAIREGETAAAKARAAAATAAKAAAKAAAAVTAKRLKAAVDWTTYVTRDSVARNVTGWVREKVKALLGEDEPSLVEFVSDALASKPASAAKLVALLEPMLGDETGPFVDELWRVLARETTERPDA